MELSNEFRVSAPPPQAYDVLTNVERIAPMLPGAQLQEIEGDDYRGIVKVKVGPITAQYKGTATFVERDREAGRVVLKASGRDSRGQGHANAVITAQLTPDGEGTKVSVVTDLSITGKVASFGRGTLAEVSAKLLGQFADALEADLDQSGSPAEASAPGEAGAASEGEPASEPTAKPTAKRAAKPTAKPTAKPKGEPTAEPTGDSKSEPIADAPLASEAPPTRRQIDQPEPEPVDLWDAAGDSVTKRVGPLVAVGLVILLLVIRRARRRRR